MTEHKWFIPELDDPADMTSEEHAFAAALSEATAGLVCPEVHDLLIPSEHSELADGVLTAGLSLSDQPVGKNSRHLVDFGVHFSGDRVRGGRLHNQIYSLSGLTPSLAIDVVGTLDDLASRTAQWFEEVLRRPVVLYVWLNDGYAYAARFAFADTSETLAQCYTRSLAPQGQYETVTAAGFVRGRGWLQTDGLPAPDVYLPVRGDQEAAIVPSGVRRAAERGPISGVWYE